MDLQELRQEAIKIIKANPELKSEIQDLFSLAISEVEEGGSESHECDLAYNDMIELSYLCLHRFRNYYIQNLSYDFFTIILYKYFVFSFLFV